MTPIRCRWYRRRLERVGGVAARDAGSRAHRHVRSCERCRRMLADEELVAAMLGRLELPEPPSRPRVWRQIERRLQVGEVSPSPPLTEGPVRRAVGWVLHEAPIWAVGIVAFLALLGLWQSREWAVSGPGPAQREAPTAPSRTARETETPATPGRQLAMVPLNLDLGTYVQEVALSSQPDEFWRAYRARAPGADAPFRDLDFQPIVLEQLPHGFQRVDSKLLRDACCETLQIRYESAGQWLDIFQCHDDHPIAFGQALVDRRDVSGIVSTAFDWDEGRIRGRSFVLGELSLVAVGNVTDEVLDDVVRDLARR